MHSSFQTEHTKRSIVFKKGLRVSRTCSYEKDFRNNTMEMKSWILKRGYPKSLVEKELERLNFLTKLVTSNKRKGYPLCCYIPSNFEEYR